MPNSNREDKIRKDITKFYDSVASQFSQTRGNWWDNLDFFKKYIHDGDKLLDFGCGNGRLLEFIYGNHLMIKYTGIDVSKELIEIAKRKYEKEKFLTIKKENKTSFKRDYFDVIFSIAVFHHFDKGMAENTLKEMRRITKKDGIIVITAWYLWNKKRLDFLVKNFFRNIVNFKSLKMSKLPFSYSKKGGGQETFWRTCYWWNKKELEKVAEKSGFEVLESGHSRDNRNDKRNIYIVLRRA